MQVVSCIGYPAEGMSGSSADGRAPSTNSHKGSTGSGCSLPLGSPPGSWNRGHERGWEAQRRGKLCTVGPGEGQPLWEGKVKTDAARLPSPRAAQGYLFTPPKATRSEDQGMFSLLTVK